MALNINREVAAMKRMTTGELKEKFEEVCKQSPRSHNRQWLIKKIAWRLQAEEEGGLPERVRRRALEMADDADLRVRPTRGFGEKLDAAQEQTSFPTAEARDPRVPPPGTILNKTYKGQQLSVLVRHSDFEFNGEVYSSLSAIANAVTGSHVNGYTFFGLNRKKETRR